MQETNVKTKNCTAKLEHTSDYMHWSGAEKSVEASLHRLMLSGTGL